MKYLNHPSDFDKFPSSKADGVAYEGYSALVNELQASLSEKPLVIFEMYPGCNENEIKDNLIAKLGFDEVVDIEDCAKDEKTLNDWLEPFLTEDRVFGLMTHFQIQQFYEMDKVAALKKRIASSQKRIAVYGFGSSLISKNAPVIYFEMSRWEIQLRQRQGQPNWHCHNYDEDTLKKYKRGFFIEWRSADRLKKKVLPLARYLVDTTLKDDPKMVRGSTFFKALASLPYRPFRLVPYYDPGVWGGQWMKEVCGLDPRKKNYAWSFDGVPEENALHFDFGGVIFEFPAIDLVFFEPSPLLGERVYGRFGSEFPIRFDMLDTMEGGNLSLQCHPLTTYIQDKYGMAYTQDESYFILAAGPGSSVYLGVKDNVDKAAMFQDLEEAEKGEHPFPAEKYVNQFPAHAFDHFLIPGGTIHCSGANTMVLEISATPYIFTFKMWDWGRFGLDGKPRPIHVKEAQESIQFNRDATYAKKELINRFVKISDKEVHTGLHPLEFIETRLYTFNDSVSLNSPGSFSMCNLVQGAEARIESVDGSFEPYTIHYAETFIIPEGVKAFRLVSPRGEEVKIIRAYVRG